eukprot:1713564-Lingulodinium_polyedra.AAC.1
MRRAPYGAQRAKLANCEKKRNDVTTQQSGERMSEHLSMLTVRRHWHVSRRCHNASQFAVRVAHTPRAAR